MIKLRLITCLIIIYITYSIQIDKDIKNNRNIHNINKNDENKTIDNRNLNNFIKYLYSQYPRHYIIPYVKGFNINNEWNINWNILSKSKIISNFTDLYINNNERN